MYNKHLSVQTSNTGKLKFSELHLVVFETNKNILLLYPMNISDGIIIKKHQTKILNHGWVEQSMDAYLNSIS